SRIVGSSALVAALLVSAPPASAQQPDAQAIRQEIDQLKKDFDARLTALESRLAAIEGQTPGAPPAAAPSAQPPSALEAPAGAQGAGGPSGALPVYGNVSAASKIFNPDIAVIGNFL